MGGGGSPWRCSGVTPGFALRSCSWQIQGAIWDARNRTRVHPGLAMCKANALSLCYSSSPLYFNYSLMSYTAVGSKNTSVFPPARGSHVSRSESGSWHCPCPPVVIPGPLGTLSPNLGKYEFDWQHQLLGPG